MEQQKTYENLRAYTLFSGSDGNCAYIQCKNTEILIDAGVSMRAIEKSLQKIGTSLSNIDAIFITHEHIDHVKALKMISAKHDIPIFITQESLEKMLSYSDDAVREEKCQKMEIGRRYHVGEIEILPFRTSHDSAMSVGFVIKCQGLDCVYKIGVATDLGRVTENVADSLLGCNAVIIEANHDKTMLSYGKYPYALKRRIFSEYGHLSNEDCAQLVSKLVDGGTNRFLLAHLSKENNIPHLALREVRSIVGENENLYIEIAQRDIPCCLIEL